MLFHDLSRIIDHQHFLATQRCLDEILRIGDGNGAGKHPSGGGGEGGHGDSSGGRSVRISISSPATLAPRPKFRVGRTGLGGGGWREAPAPDDNSSSSIFGGAPGEEEEDDIYGATPLCSPQHSHDGNRNARSPRSPPVERNGGVCGVAPSRPCSPSRRIRVPPPPKREQTSKEEHAAPPAYAAPDIPHITTTATTTTTNVTVTSKASLTLIAEDVSELAAFYAAVFDDEIVVGGVTSPQRAAEGEEVEEVMLALKGGSAMRLLSSRAAAAAAALGPGGLHVARGGRGGDAGGRVVLGARVRDVEAIRARLARLEIGERARCEDEGDWRGLVNAQQLTAAAVVGGDADAHLGSGQYYGTMRRRSVVFWDPAGYCWEAWEEGGVVEECVPHH